MDFIKRSNVFHAIVIAATLLGCGLGKVNAATHDASKKEFCEVIALSARVAYVDRLKGRPLPEVSANKANDFFYPLSEYARDYGYKTAKSGADAERAAFAKCMANSDYAMQQFDRGNRISSAQLLK